MAEELERKRGKGEKEGKRLQGEGRQHQGSGDAKKSAESKCRGKDRRAAPAQAVGRTAGTERRCVLSKGRGSVPTLPSDW